MESIILKNSSSNFFIKCTSVIIITVFAILVLSGVTGSSLGWGFKAANISSEPLQRILGVDRQIRSDEWAVTTAATLAQVHHNPPFPVVNSAFGGDGMNMLIMGGAGQMQVPIAHISSLAKPQTWGYFLFDLKHAMAWQWWFPIFSTLLALWWMLCILAPGQTRINLALSALFCFSPYVATWSNTQLYYCFFPIVSFCLISRIFLLSTRAFTVLLGVPLGLSIVGFVLALYPAWQVSIGYVFVIVVIIRFVEEKWYRKLSINVIFSLVIAFGVSALLLVCWYLDARDAIQAMTATIYPGSRFSTGGGMSLASYMQGYSNIYTIYKENLVGSNQSEISAYLYMTLPLLALVYWMRKSGLKEALITSLSVYLLLFLYFEFVGIPAWLAKYTLFSNVTSQRGFLAVELIEVLLISLVSSARRNHSKIVGEWGALGVAAIWTFLIFYSMRHSTYYDMNLRVLVLPICAAAFFGAYWLVIGDTKKFACLFLVWSVSIYLPFNPLVRIPDHLTLADDVKNLLPSPDSRVLVVDGGSAVPMYFAALGLNVVNGVFYYPPKKLWEQLDPTNEYSGIHNRYQHLYFNSRLSQQQSVVFSTPHPDLILVDINPSTFDFESTGADVVIVPTGIERNAITNDGLTLIGSTRGWSFMRVVKGAVSFDFKNLDLGHLKPVNDTDVSYNESQRSLDVTSLGSDPQVLLDTASINSFLKCKNLKIKLVMKSERGDPIQAFFMVPEAKFYSPQFSQDSVASGTSKDGYITHTISISSKSGFFGDLRIDPATSAQNLSIKEVSGVCY
ncbi:DUF7657 domain-containing protein [Pseudomonas japonica]|uniref:DUF7657 domain-containing protein n=1 Tax=Pseudomonas japonica TaxID=256466 RepID=UPI0015E3B344|nr:hypothetical protein [Pseudomonas japonica]MBA1288769.1 hypothetical protein [Pseudomonas japonica]